MSNIHFHDRCFTICDFFWDSDLSGNFSLVICYFQLLNELVFEIRAAIKQPTTEQTLLTLCKSLLSKSWLKLFMFLTHSRRISRSGKRLEASAACTWASTTCRTPWPWALLCPPVPCRDHSVFTTTSSTAPSPLSWGGARRNSSAIALTCGPWPLLRINVQYAARVKNQAVHKT